MPEPNPYFANLQRGSLLLNSGRANEALPFLQAAIAANPDAAPAYAELARCWNEIPTQRSKVIPAINRAIGLAPDVSSYHGLKGWFLVCQMKHRAALKAAQEGVAIDPNCIRSLNAVANVHTKMARWKKAEAACRRILGLNPFDPPALNLLAQALHRQGRWKESRETVGRLLANMPNDAFGHANAGFAALAAGDHLRANEHFRDSLRRNPNFELARRGLLESLRARFWTVRLNNRILSFLQEPMARIPVPPIFLHAAILFLFALGSIIVLNRIHTDAGFNSLAVLGAVLLIYLGLSLLMRILGNVLLMFDPLGRYALTSKEKARACYPLVWFGLISVSLFPAYGWLALGTIFSVIALLALSIQWPLLKDRWLRHRGERSA